MRKKLLATVLLLTMALSLTACGKEQATGLEVVPEFGNTETVSEEEVKEVSLLEGQSYRVDIVSQNNTTSYKKTVSGSEYSYTLSDVNLLLGQSQAYCNGSDLYVYTNVSPTTGTTLDEYVWIRNGENPFEKIEDDVLNLFVPSNMSESTDLTSLKFTDENFIDDMCYLKSLGYESVELFSNVGCYEFRLKDGEMNTDYLRISVEGQSFFGSNPPIVVPDITDCKEVTDFNSSAEQLSGNGVITEEDYANHLVDGYYFEDGTFAYYDNGLQSWEYYMGGVLISSYNYENNMYFDHINGFVQEDYYKSSSEEEMNEDVNEDEILAYAGDNSSNFLDTTILGVPFTLDSTRADIECVCWYGEIKEDVYFDNVLYNCTDETFSKRFDEVYNTFSIRYMVENFDKFDKTTQICIIGMTDYCNFSIDGKTTFKDMLIASGISIDEEMLNEFWLYANGSTMAEE